MPFQEAATHWLDDGRRRRGWKPSTPADYETMLSGGQRVPNKRGSAPGARAKAAFQGYDVRSIMTADAEAG